MSRKFLNKINMMTTKGEYPSLKVLLEEKEDDFSFDDEDKSSDEGEKSSDESEKSSDESEKSSGPDLNAPSSEEEKEAENFNDSSTLSSLEQNLNMVNSYNPDIIHKLVVNKHLRHANVEISTNEYKSEKDKVAESYSLKTLLLLNEDLSGKVKDAVKVIDDMQDDINKVDGYVKSIELKGKGKKINIPALIHSANELASHFEHHYCKYSIIAADTLKTVIKQSELGKEEENCEKFIEEFVEELDKMGVDHAISINTVKQNDYDIGVGAKSQS